MQHNLEYWIRTFTKNTKNHVNRNIKKRKSPPANENLAEEDEEK